MKTFDCYNFLWFFVCEPFFLTSQLRAACRRADVVCVQQSFNILTLSENCREKSWSFWSMNDWTVKIDADQYSVWCRLTADHHSLRHAARALRLLCSLHLRSVGGLDDTILPQISTDLSGWAWPLCFYLPWMMMCLLPGGMGVSGPV